MAVRATNGPNGQQETHARQTDVVAASSFGRPRRRFILASLADPREANVYRLCLVVLLYPFRSACSRATTDVSLVMLGMDAPGDWQRADGTSPSR